MKKREEPLMTLQATTNEVIALGAAINICLRHVRSKPQQSEEDVLLMELLLQFHNRIVANLSSSPRSPVP